MVSATPNPEPVISEEEASSIAEEVRLLIRAGDEHRAWERMRHLHPSDIGSILASLPRGSRHALVSVMSPDTVAWLFQHMNPIVAARVGARLGSGILSSTLAQAQPRTILATLRFLPGRKAQEVAEALGQPAQGPVIVEHDEDTSGALMVHQFAAVGQEHTVAAVRRKLREFAGRASDFTHVFVMGREDSLVGQVTMADLAMAENSTTIASLTTPVVASVTVDTNREECARLHRHYNLTQLPVVEDGRLIGVIPA